MKFRNIFLLTIITSLLLFKVYIANKLYYTSRNIQKLSIQINALKEERNILKLKIEKLKYKNTIIDPLFEYKPKIKEQTPQDTIEQINNQDDTYKPEPIKEQPKQKKDTKELFEQLNIEDSEQEGLI
jgi:cell division protein FtsB